MFSDHRRTAAQRVPATNSLLLCFPLDRVINDGVLSDTRCGTVGRNAQMRVSFRFALISVTCAASSVFAAALAASPGSAEPVGSQPSVVPSQSNTGELMSVADLARTVARKDNDFVAPEIVPATQSVNIYRSGSGALTDAIDNSYLALATKAVQVHIVRALLSDSQKSHLDELIQSEEPQLRASGFDLVEWGTLDGWDKPYVVEYQGDAPVPVALTSPLEVYGENSVVFRHGTVTAASRDQDTSPYLWRGRRTH